MPLEAFFGADLERALTHVSIPAYVIDTAGGTFSRVTSRRQFAVEKGSDPTEGVC